MTDFQDNFSKLKQANVIPDIDEGLLPPKMRDAIEGLTDDEIAVLTKISNNTGMHIYLNQGGIVVCGF